MRSHSASMRLAQCTSRPRFDSSFEILSASLRTSFRIIGEAHRMTTKGISRRPLRWLLSGVGGFIVLPLVGGLFPATFEPAFAVAGFAVFVLCVRRALVLWRVDDIVFDQPRKFDAGRAKRPRLAVAVVFLALAAGTVSAQQTIFNVPSADVLDKGKVYLEEDNLWRPQDPNFAVFTVRGVYGLGAHVEAGFNFGGFVTPGRSTPTAVAAVKWQPLKEGNFALTVGAHGLFFLRGSEDGDPAGHFYGHASYAFPTNTRITAGGWVATPGYAGADTKTGALVGFEQKIVDHLNLIGDWFSGKNGIGYVTPGISSTWGGWTLYAGYSFKNGDSKGNAMLFELGVTF